MNKYTVTCNTFNTPRTSEVYFDGKVYRWVSNDRVPPADTIIEYGIHKLPAYSAQAHKLARDGDLEAFLREAYPEAKPAKKKRTTIKEQATAQIEAARKAVLAIVNTLPTHPMGHAFLWANVTITLKNGNTRTYRACLGGICCEDLEAAVYVANSTKNVSGAYYVLD